MKNSRASLWTGAALAALPLVSLLPGCGGGGNVFSPQPTSGPTATPTPANLALLSNARIDIGNGQTGFLSVSRVGNAVTGTLRIANALTRAKLSAAAAVFTVPAGLYPITGSFSAPRGLTLSGTFPAPIGAFSLTATLPTTTQDGTYSITAGGQTNSGSLPHSVIVTPTATPTSGATATPTPSGTATPTPTQGGNPSATANLVFSKVQGTTTDTSPFTQIGVTSSSYQNTGFVNFSFDVRQSGGPTRRFKALLSNFPFKTTPIAQGDTFVASSINDSNATFYRENNSDAEWKANGGTVTLEKVQGNVFTFRYQNVHFVANDNGATGSFDLNGTLLITNPTKFG